MSKKSRRNIRKALMAGVALAGLSKLGEKAALTEDVSKAKAMKATEMNKRRVPAFIKKRGAGMGKAFLPKGNLQGQDFGLDPFGPGMGAKAGKMIRAKGGKEIVGKKTKLY